MTNVKGEKRLRENVISRAEFDAMLRSAAENRPHPYYALRDQAVLCIFWKTGKRRGEVARLRVSDLTVDREAGSLLITFTVLKKRRKVSLTRRRTKALSLNDPYTQPILKYLEHMRTRHPDCIYLFPSTRLTGFGDEKTVTLIPDRHLSGPQVWRIVVAAGPRTWPHLFRETQGAKVAERWGNTLSSVFAVKRRLDLESERTAMRYVARYAVDFIDREADGVDLVEPTQRGPPTSTIPHTDATKASIVSYGRVQALRTPKNAPHFLLLIDVIYGATDRPPLPNRPRRRGPRLPHP